MKKLIFLLVLISCVQKTMPMRRAGRAMTAVAIASTPLVVPSSYYILSTRQKIGKCSLSKSSCCVEEAIKNLDAFGEGVFWGLVPGPNLFFLSLRGIELLSASARRLAGDTNAFVWCRGKKHNAIGFFSGASLYISIPAAIAFFLRRVPK